MWMDKLWYIHAVELYIKVNINEHDVHLGMILVDIKDINNVTTYK